MKKSLSWKEEADFLVFCFLFILDKNVVAFDRLDLGVVDTRSS